MLLESGDLIPVKRAAADIPWTKRKAQFLNYLHRGPVDFATYVYDTNVGDIAPLATYFNPYHWTVRDLNHKFGMRPDSNSDREMSSRAPSTVSSSSAAPPLDSDDAKCRSLQPKLFIYPLQEVLPSEDGGAGQDLLSLKDCACCTGPGLTFGSVLKPKQVRAGGQVRQKPPGSPESPDRELTLPIRMDDSDTLLRAAATAFSGGSLDPIGPPKRRKVAAPSPDPDTHPSWLNVDILRAESGGNGRPEVKSYFSILSEDSPWSPWMSHSFASGFGFGDKIEQKPESGDAKKDDDLACGLRKIAQQSNSFFSGSPLP